MTEGWSSEFKGALLGGAVATIGLFGGVVLVGNVASFQALRLIEATIPTGQFLASASIAAGVTVLALMLTLIGITVSSDLTFTDIHYRRIRNINILALLVIVVAVVVLVAMAIPIGEVDEVRNYYAVLYYILAAMLSLLGGLVVAMALMIGGTVRGMVDAAHPEGKSHLVVDDSDDAGDRFQG
ncbi:MAG TPA: hypothetical protein VIW94_01020 [Acidimicrobiia bacterium]